MAAVKDNNGISYRDRHKRPDKQLYVPRALRKVGMESTSGMKRQNFDINSSNNDFERKEICMKRVQSSFSDKGTLALEKCDKLKPDLNCTEKSVDKNFVSKYVNVNNLDSVQIESTGMKYDELDKCIDTKKLEEKIVKDLKTSIHCPETIVPKDLSEKTSKTEQPKLNIDEVCAKKECSSENLAKLQQNNQVDSYQSLDSYTSPKQYEERMKYCDIQDEASGEEDSWENMFNDDGDCIDPKFIKEITHIAGRMQLTVAKNDYSDYKSVSGSVSEEYNNMVELYGFPVEFTTQDLTSAFSVFQKASYTIKWVDDCHALAIFSSPVIANQALHLNHPFVKVRPLSEGIKESKTKARLCDHLCEEPKPRPATSAALARRLVTGALGLKVHTSKEQRDIERNMLKEAREKKKLKAKQRQDIWNGIVS